MGADELAVIRARAAAATPGPWRWSGDIRWHTIRLFSTTPAPYRWTVMDFARWGMRDAAPRFRGADGAMTRADEFPVFEVCRDATSKDDPRVYRADIVDVRHSDAQFIAHARADVDWLIAEVERLRALTGEDDGAA